MTRRIKLNIKLIPTILSSFIWLLLLRDTHSYFLIYIITSLLAIVFNIKELNRNQNNCVPVCFSIILSLFVVLANYEEIMYFGSYLLDGTLYLITFVTGFIIFYFLIIGLNNNKLELYHLLFDENFINNDIARKIELYSFLLVTACHLSFLFLSQYPGGVGTDAIAQISQIETGIYSHHHPFWHTIIIQVFYEIGKFIKDANFGIALYNTAQVLLFSAVISQTAKLLYELRCRIRFVVLYVFSFLLLPYNLFFSIFTTKDVPFSLFVLLMLCSLIRMFENIGNNRTNTILYITSSFGVCLFRTNGWLAFFCLTLFFVLLMRKKKKILVCTIFVLLTTFIMQHQVIDYLGIKRGDLVESLSIPAQQIARTVKFADDLSSEEVNLLNEVVDVEKLPDTYVSYISDDVKRLVRATDNQEYIKEHIFDYAKLYINLGLRHPLMYIQAWVKQTCGYFNSGYHYYRYYEGVDKNIYGIEAKPLIPEISIYLHSYENIYYNTGIAQIFEAIGAYTWIFVLILCLSIINKKMNLVAITILPISIILTLLVASPVHCEFRYAYQSVISVFLVFMYCIYSIGKE